MIAGSAVVALACCLAAGWLPDYGDARSELPRAGARAEVELSTLLRPLGILAVGVAVGAAVGVVAGWVAADPAVPPLPGRLRGALLALLLILTLLYVAGTVATVYGPPRDRSSDPRQQWPAGNNPGD